MSPVTTFQSLDWEEIGMEFTPIGAVLVLATLGVMLFVPRCKTDGLNRRGEQLVGCLRTIAILGFVGAVSWCTSYAAIDIYRFASESVSLLYFASGGFANEWATRAKLLLVCPVAVIFWRIAPGLARIVTRRLNLGVTVFFAVCASILAAVAVYAFSQCLVVVVEELGPPTRKREFEDFYQRLRHSDAKRWTRRSLRFLAAAGSSWLLAEAITPGVRLGKSLVKTGTLKSTRD